MYTHFLHVYRETCALHISDIICTDTDLCMCVQKTCYDVHCTGTYIHIIHIAYTLVYTYTIYTYKHSIPHHIHITHQARTHMHIHIQTRHTHTILYSPYTSTITHIRCRKWVDRVAHAHTCIAHVDRPT